MNTKKAFSLIELLVVISIIAVIIGLSLFGMQGARKSARDTGRKSDLEIIRSALELYKADCNLYPLTAEIPAPGEPLVGPVACGGNTYLGAMPTDPISTERQYSYVSDGTSYALCAALEAITSPQAGCGNCEIDLSGAVCSHKVLNP